MQNALKHMKSAITILFTLLLALVTVRAAETKSGVDDLKHNFITPPNSARPWVYWFPLSGSLTKEGITADLEAMARVGIGGVLYMEVSEGAPKELAGFAGPRWREMFDHACKEARRLGLEINLNNDAGWTGSGGPWITPELSMQKVVWSEMTVEGGKKVEVNLPQPKAVRNYFRDIAVLAMPAGFTNAVVVRNQIVDLTGCPDWEAPPGKWLLIRFGHTTTGAGNQPAPESGHGLECDKFSKKAVAAHFNAFVGTVLDDHKALVSTHIDSWEVGTQNWTPNMREEFRSRRGYDLWKFLPTLAGRTVDSVETTERFMWDFQQTLSDLIVENYAGEMRRLANERGLRLSIEAYGGPTDDMTYAGQADEPMAEFWAWEKFGAAFSCIEMSSAAHTYGKRILGAEAFTSNNNEKWLSHPGNIKDVGDWAFCEGINRFVFHRYAAQPWLNVAPGMSMGPWGLHYERTQTWWESSKPWHQYLARCQSLLQQGLFVADVAYLQPEGAPRTFAPPADAHIARNIRGGYNFDGCTPEVVLKRFAVKDGRLVLPDGMSYRLLALPDTKTMTLPLLRRIKELADAGATILAGPKPPQKSPSLTDNDAEVKQLADALWPRLITGKTVANVLSERGVKPDFSATPMLRYIHRRIDGADVYFVANPAAIAVDAMASFRVTGKRPEFWWPDSGRIRKADAFEEKDGVTTVPISFEANESVFVVFREPSGGVDPVVRVTRDGQLIRPRKPEIRIQEARYGVPGDPARTRDVQKKVQALVDGGKTAFRVGSLADGDDPARGVVKTLTVAYTGNGQPATAEGKDNDTLDLEIKNINMPPTTDLSRGEIWENGEYVFQTASGKTRQVAVSLPQPQTITGPWEVGFDPKWGGPAQVTFEKLEDWSQRPEPGIKYYSGTATYRTVFQAKKSKCYLDLGKVAVMADVTLNGKYLGTLWKSPYRVAVTDALKDGENTLEVKVVNLWVNRQIGDEFLPEDCDRNENGSLKSWPQWVLDGKSSPTGRFTFSSWKLWKKRDPLQESGLIGPVKLQTIREEPITP